jgi:predicted hydrolase (HD superfamily)
MSKYVKEQKLSKKCEKVAKEKRVFAREIGEVIRCRQ